MARTKTSGTKGEALSPEVMANCTCLNLRKATRAVTQFYDDMLQPAGIKATQYSVLALIVRQGPLPVSQLAAKLVMDRTTLTRNLRPLEQAGWIRIKPGADRRVRMVEATAHGRKRLDRALPLWRKAQRQVVKDLGADQWRDLIGRLNAAVAVMPPP